MSGNTKEIKNKRKKTILERVDEFRKNKPKSAKLTIIELEEIRSAGSTFNIIVTAFYYGYMKGSKASKGGAK